MPGLSAMVTRAWIGLAVAAALALAGCGGSSSDESGSSTSTTKNRAPAAQPGGAFSKDVVAACSTFKTAAADAGIDVPAQIEATETFRESLEDISDPSNAEAEVMTWADLRLQWLNKLDADPNSAGKAPVSDAIGACGESKGPSANDEACNEFDDAWDSLVAGVQVTPAAAQPEANILLARNPPADVVAAIGVLVTAADGLSGPERGLDRDASAETVRTWAETIC